MSLEAPEQNTCIVCMGTDICMCICHSVYVCMYIHVRNYVGTYVCMYNVHIQITIICTYVESDVDFNLWVLSYHEYHVQVYVHTYLCSV